MPTVEAQGAVLIARDGQRFTSHARRLSTKRGSIKRFTVASRRRLIELTARLSVSGVRTVFLTLTFAGTPTAEQAKAAFKRFRMRLDRKYPKWSAVWRMEFQERGAIHFHLICFRLPFIAQAALQNLWQGCTREALSIVHIELISGGARQVMGYVSKYVAKLDRRESFTSLDKAPYPHDEREDSDDPGRFWGTINRSKLPYAVRRKIAFYDTIAFNQLWSWMTAATKGKIGDYRHNARCYTDNVYGLIDRLSRVASCIVLDITHANGARITMAG